MDSLYSEDAERAIVASLLIDSGLIHTTDLRASEFFIRRYAIIYHAVRTMTDRKIPVDMLTMREYLENHKRLDEVGGMAGLASLVTEHVTSLHLPEYCSIVRDKANRRAAVNLCGEISRAAYDESKPYSAGYFANELLKTESSSNDTLHISQTLSNFLDWQLGRVEMRLDGDLDSLPVTKIPELDEVLVYLEEGQETIIAGEPGVGKTMLVQQIVEANAGLKSVIFSMEMKHTRLTARLVSARSGVPVSAMRLGLPQNTDFLQQKINNAVAELEVSGIYINDRPGITVEGMYSETARLIAGGTKISLCAIDYFGLIADNRQYENNIEKETAVSAKLQRMFRELGIHGLVIDTYNKAGFNGSQGRMGNITGAARKSYDADNVITLTLGESVNAGQLVHADIVKVRDGEVSNRRVSLMRERGKPSYRSLSQAEKNNIP